MTIVARLRDDESSIPPMRVEVEVDDAELLVRIPGPGGDPIAQILVEHYEGEVVARIWTEADDPAGGGDPGIRSVLIADTAGPGGGS
jgi:hypothetical protein